MPASGIQSVRIGEVNVLDPASSGGDALGDVGFLDVHVEEVGHDAYTRTADGFCDIHGLLQTVDQMSLVPDQRLNHDHHALRLRVLTHSPERVAIPINLFLFSYTFHERSSYGHRNYSLNAKLTGEVDGLLEEGDSGGEVCANIAEVVLKRSTHTQSRNRRIGECGLGLFRALYRETVYQLDSLVAAIFKIPQLLGD